jgi:hypothetical protein
MENLETSKTSETSLFGKINLSCHRLWKIWNQFEILLKNPKQVMKVLKV